MKTVQSNFLKICLFLISPFVISCQNQKDYTNAINNDSELAAIDLGLSVNWANKNLGADKASCFGGYYPITKYMDIFDEIEVDEGGRKNPECVDPLGVLSLEYDIANQSLGEEWRLPTYDEIVELVYNCEWNWGTLDQTEGAYVTGPNGNTIFLPAAGTEDSRYGDAPFGIYRMSFVWDGGAAYLIEFAKPKEGFRLTPESSPFASSQFNTSETNKSNNVGMDPNILFDTYGVQVPLSVRPVKPK